MGIGESGVSAVRGEREPIAEPKGPLAEAFDFFGRPFYSLSALAAGDPKAAMGQALTGGMQLGMLPITGGYSMFEPKATPLGLLDATGLGTQEEVTGKHYEGTDIVDAWAPGTSEHMGPAGRFVFNLGTAVLGDPLLGLGRCPVVDGDVVACGDEVTRHRIPHDPQADECASHGLILA